MNQARNLYLAVREEKVSKVAEQQAIKLAAHLGYRGNPEEVLGMLSKTRRVELHQIYEKKHKDQFREGMLDLLVFEDNPRYRAVLDDPIGTLDVDLARSPKTPPQKLEQLVWCYPQQVSKNPALSNISLENPELGMRIQENIKEALEYQNFERLLRGSNRLELVTWVYRCAERALLRCPESMSNLVPSEVLEAAMACAKRELGNERLRYLQRILESAHKQIEARLSKAKEEGERVSLLCWSASVESVMFAAETALYGAIVTAQNSASKARISAENDTVEDFWQQEALREIHRQALKKTVKQSPPSLELL